MAKKPVMIGIQQNNYKTSSSNSGKYQIWEMTCLSCGQIFTNNRPESLEGKTQQVRGNHLHIEGCTKTDRQGNPQNAAHFYRKESCMGDGFPEIGASEGVAKLIGYCD